MQDTNLFNLVNYRSISFRVVQKYLRDALEGLSYLLFLGFCHLDLKPDNMLVGNSRAMLCDFGFVAYARLTNSHGGMAYSYRPPEASFSLWDESAVPNGRACDLRGFGVMVVEVVTYFSLHTEIVGGVDWSKEAYPVFFKVLQKDELLRRVNLPRSRKGGRSDDLRPRPLVSEEEHREEGVLRHPFLSGGKRRSFHRQPRDLMWKENGSTLSRFVSHCLRQLAKMRAHI